MFATQVHKTVHGQPIVEKTVILSFGQTLTIDNWIQDLTGTIVTTDKPVSILAGHECADIPHGGPCDALYTSHTTINDLGKLYIVPPIPNRDSSTGYIVRIVAPYDNTDVFVFTGNLWVKQLTLIKSHFVELDLHPTDKAQAIKCIKLCLVVQYNKHRHIDNRETDNSMWQLPDLEHYVREVTFVPVKNPGTIVYSNNLIIIARADATASLQLNGASLTPSWTTLDAWPEFSYATLQISNQLHNLSSEGQFGAFVFGNAAQTGYGTMLAMDSKYVDP